MGSSERIYFHSTSQRHLHKIVVFVVVVVVDSFSWAIMATALYDSIVTNADSNRFTDSYAGCIDHRGVVG